MPTLNRCEPPGPSCETGHRLDHLKHAVARRCWLKKLPSVVSGSSAIGGGSLRDDVGLVVVRLHGRFAEQRVGPERALGDGQWFACARRSTVASGGVNVPSVAVSKTLGKNPPVATSECRGERLASTRVNELNHFEMRNWSSGRLGTSAAL